MLLLLDWLKDFVNIPKNITPEKLGELLTLHTVEVESIKKLGENLGNIVVGKILQLEPHPNADKLKLATVDIGKEKLKVVCGGSNLYEGMLVAFAKVGAKIKWHGQGELVELQAAEIRGVRSTGMICAASEIGLADLFPAKDDHEVIDLIPSVSPSYKGGEKILGRPLAEALGLDDVVYEIDNKSITNRPDLWGHYGIARELATLMATNLKRIATNKFKFSNKFKIKVKVEDKKLCPRYMAVAVDGVEIKSSPAWMQKRLIACGMRPINNIVDITNYVMLELGQPTHAFDAQKLGNIIIVRRAKQNEKITTLDGQERKLDEEMLLITDGKNPVAIAGVMGGGNSEIDNNTKSIVIESANFNPISIRQTSQKLGLRSEASMRFEKSLDQNLCELAIQRIVNLIKESCPQAKAASNLADVKNFKLNQGPIKLDLAWLNKKIGVEVPRTKVVKILQNLGFKTSPLAPLLGKERGIRGEALHVKVPTWRATKDISLPEDLAEEVARIYGYDNIKLTMPQVSMQAPEVNIEREFINKIKDILSGGAGMTEVYNYSFVNEAQLGKLEMNAGSNVKLANPLTREHTLLRQSLIPNLLQNIITNQRQAEEIKIYEIGRVFLPQAGEFAKGGGSKEKLPLQPFKLGLIYASGSGALFSLKGILENLSESLNISFDFKPQAQKRADIYSGGKLIGCLDNFDEKLAVKNGVKTKLALAELDLQIMLAAAQGAGIKKYAAKNKFPYVRRDLAFVVDEKIVYNDFRQALLAASPLIKEVELFDVYQGEKLGVGKKSWAFTLAFGHSDKTLTGAEADKVQTEIVKQMEKKFSAQLRDF